MKKYLWILFASFIILFASIFWSLHVSSNTPSLSKVTNELPANDYKTVPLIMASTTFTAEIADTPTLQQLGLSYRTLIGSRDAMLFVFPKPGNYQFWMVGMNFPLDIIWLDANKKVIFIEPNLSPATYPESFGPTQDSQYVIEVAASTAQSIGLKLGSQVQFSCDGYFCMR